MGWPLNSWWACSLLGLLIGTLFGGAIGAVVDYTLTRLGAGPARAREEVLVTVRTDDQGMERIRGVFFDHRARHVLGAEVSA